MHYRCYDGNVTDDQTHIDTWSTVRDIRKSSDFLYVADSKLCTRENMRFIDEAGGRFLTVLPRSRIEDINFRKRLCESAVPWKVAVRRKARRRKDGIAQVYECFEPQELTAEGYRLVSYRSSVKATLDQARRHRRIHRARRRPTKLAERNGAHAFRTLERAREAAEKVLGEEGAKGLVIVNLKEVPSTEMEKLNHAPAELGLYQRGRRPRIVFELIDNQAAISAEARCDGVFAMVTNERSKTPEELLDLYKYQPFLEKRNEQLKSVLAVAPIFLKDADRVAGLLFLYYVAILLFALIERQLRQTMKRFKIESLPLYPEGRSSKAPTADLFFRNLENHRAHALLDAQGKQIRLFHDPVTPVAEEVIDLLEVPRHHYGL